MKTTPNSNQEPTNSTNETINLETENTDHEGTNTHHGTENLNLEDTTKGHDAVILEHEVTNLQNEFTNSDAEVTTSQSDHCHKERTDFEKRTKKAVKKLWIASALCVCFMICEIVGGVLSNSLAIATDAAHLLTDLAAFMISIFAIWLGSRPPSRNFPFGWHRAEVIGALFSVLTIWLLTGILLKMAIGRLINMDFEIEATIMLIASGIGIFFNVIMASVLHQSSITRQHPHRSSTSFGRSSERVGGNINVRAALLHVIGDLILSIGIFIAALIMYFKEDWKIVDPLCTIFFSFLVLLTTYQILKDILIVLMEGTPRGTNMDRVIHHLMGIEGVVAIHNIRIWALSLEKRALSAHLVINPAYSANDILNAANTIIKIKFNFFEHTIQVEPYTLTMSNCIQCKPFSK